MTRPTIVRADTIDLQDHNAPSAKDHHHTPDVAPGSSSPAPIAPHQAETLREVAHETAEEEARSPRVSWSNGKGGANGDASQHYVHDGDGDDLGPDMYHHENHQHHEDALAIAQNGGISSSDEGDLDGDADGDLDDDMMDKISSSPSIEDGPCFQAKLQLKSHLHFPRQVYASKNLESQPPSGNADVIIFLRESLSSAESDPGQTEGGQSPTSESYAPGLSNLSELCDEGDPVGYDADGAPLTIPYEPSSEEDDDVDVLEDIDFEFVYALHTFVATVEGQANATKGDTMVLLDDSNSYWWLVRVVKDSSIGYLPAEHIETPTERLARLNKHRNIDLSATMLGDQAQKQKNSFVSIRRRRKTVTFADPTYVDYSDFDYSTDEEDIEELFGPHPTAATQQRERQKQDQKQNGSGTSAEDGIVEESARVEPLKTRAAKEDPSAEPATDEPASQNDARDSDEIVEKPEGPSRSRNGTVRNTDSFFKDETVETKKITLTPNLLRDDNTPRESSESTNRDVRSRSSLDKLDKELVSDKDRKKAAKDKDKKGGDKKPSAIRSFFSRKDKKKTSEEDDESFGKRSMDIISESRDSEDRIAEEPATDKQAGAQRASGKLQKAAPSGKASTGSAGAKSVELSSYLSEGRTNDVSNVPPASMRIVETDSQQTREAAATNQQAVEPARERSSSNAAQQVISKIIPSRTASTTSDAKPRKTVKAKTRMELDESDSSEVEDAQMERGQTVAPEPTKGDKENREKTTRPQLPGAYPDSYLTASTVASDTTVTPGPEEQVRSEDSSIPPSNSSATASSNPPALVVDTSSPEAVSPEASPSPDQSHPANGNQKDGSANREPTWDDTKLRAFFDETDHIRDLLAVVYDKTDVEPVGSDHPAIGGLFREQNAKLAEITTQLDNMLGDWLARKQRLRGTI
ncbi:SH3 domain containing protein [Purpureocillium lavendulum]|uniref:SH3 domain containing protein n=1 Tax=Purpureocillium lavendulum TaxID=1247861 RepID=A0AB34FKK0_9HYPO|nr:SH3 domain containing protein [Purpureocillium lavendulum]